MKAPWLSIIGLGDDGLVGLTPAATSLLRQARFIFGGERHLALVGALEARMVPWPSPLEGALDDIVALRGQAVCVLASGDPFFYGVGSTLVKRIDPNEIICLPAPSAFALTTARLGWAQQDCSLLSLHARPLERLIPHLSDKAKVVALSWDGRTPRAVADLLTARGFGQTRVIVCEHLGGERERIRQSLAQDFHFDDIRPLNVVALDVVAGNEARILPRSSGLPDEWFEHDGQITKCDIRAATLSALAPRRGECLWDIGAGSGSIAIEWMLADPANKAVAVERDHVRAARISRNAAALGTPGLEVVIGAAPEALAGLASPDAVFVGGGATRPGVLDAAVSAVRPGGRLVVNAVTLETQAELFARFRALGGDLVQITIAHAERVGTFYGFRPAMPVVRWRWIKPT